MGLEIRRPKRRSLRESVSSVLEETSYVLPDTTSNKARPTPREVASLERGRDKFGIYGGKFDHSRTFCDQCAFSEPEAQEDAEARVGKDPCLSCSSRIGGNMYLRKAWD